MHISINKTYMENWKEITFKGSTMQVSNLGRVRRLKPNGEYFLYKISQARDGYCQCAGGSVHSLVAMAFLNHKPNGHSLVVHHKDGNRSNNNLDNLEVISHSQNILKKQILKTSMYNYVHAVPSGWKVSMLTDKGCRYFGTFDNEDDAGKVAEFIAKILKK